MGIWGFLQMKELPSVSGKPGRGSQVPPEQEHRCGAAWRGGSASPSGSWGVGESSGTGAGGSPQPTRSSVLAYSCSQQLSAPQQAGERGGRELSTKRGEAVFWVLGTNRG